MMFASGPDLFMWSSGENPMVRKDDRDRWSRWCEIDDRWGTCSRAKAWHVCLSPARSPCARRSRSRESKTKRLEYAEFKIALIYAPPALLRPDFKPEFSQDWAGIDDWPNWRWAMAVGARCIPLDCYYIRTFKRVSREGTDW